MSTTATLDRAPTTVTRWDDLAPEAPGAVQRRLIAGEGASLREVRVPAGTTAARHAHDHEQFVLVLSGGGRLTGEGTGGEVALAPGTVIRFAPGAWHEAVFDRETVLVEVNLAR